MMSAVDFGRCSRDTKTLGASRLQSAERMMSAVDSDAHGSADESPLASRMIDSDGPIRPTPKAERLGRSNRPTPTAWVPADFSLLNG